MAKANFKVADFNCRQSLGYLSRRMHNLLQPRAEALFADAELSFTQWIALMGLKDGIASTAAELARHLNHDTGATTRMVDQMEARGLIARERSTEDRRVVHLVLTSQGRAMAKALLPRMIDFWNEVMDGFSQAEVDQLTDLMTRAVARIEATPIVETERKRA